VTGSRTGKPFGPARPSADEWRRLGPALDMLLDAAPDRRSALLGDLSGGDAVRRAELEQLVAECERMYPLLERPAADRFPAVFGDESPSMPETLAGRYRVVREAGRGGMAVVYLARDLKHGRDVAVKVVRPELALALGRSRFLREIEIAARLRHPHIVPVYDSGEEPAAPGDSEGSGAGGPLLYYVMPYEPGHSLRERLTEGGPLSIEDAVLILRDVCAALAHAHQQGIVHRDIKPENLLLSGRQAMITDFGVARAVSEAAEATGVARGGSFGTPTYMAPEQAARDPGVDHRADIYSVGVLANELLAGRPPGPLAALIAKCLATRPADRWQSAAELLGELEAIGVPAGAETSRVRSRPAAVITGIAIGAALLAAIAVALTRDRGERLPFELGRARQLTSDPGLEIQPAMSPDGRYVAYATGHSLRMHIVVRPVQGGRATPLTPDTMVSQWLPRWSPDGARILFLSGGGVHSAPARGGPSREEVASRTGAAVKSATWSADGRRIAYVRGDSLLVRTAGADDVRLVGTATDLHSCSWSPDGVRFACVSGNAFYVTVGTLAAGAMFGNLGPSSIVLVPAAGGPPVAVTDSRALHQSPVWSRDGRTLYFVSNRQGPRDVYALDVAARAPAGREPVRVTTGMGVQSIDFSADGSRIVYAAYASTANVWAIPIPVDAPASPASAVQVTTGNQTVEGVRVSPDGRWILYDSDVGGSSDVYRVPVTGGEAERLTRGPLDEFRGALSPNGKELVYHVFQAGSRHVFLQPLDGGAAQQLTRSAGQRSMANWSPDGTALAMFDMTKSQVLVMRRDAAGRWSAPRFVGGTGWRPEWSPDGRSIAFVAPADGRIGVVPADSGTQRDVYLPSPGDPLAELAVYSPTGRTLYFKSHDARGRGSFWSIPVTGGRPRLLVRFDDPARASNRFEFASDGKRFYFTVEDRQSDVWVAEVARR
jgi:Tol biopolymer transport system component